MEAYNKALTDLKGSLSKAELEPKEIRKIVNRITNASRRFQESMVIKQNIADFELELENSSSQLKRLDINVESDLKGSNSRLKRLSVPKWGIGGAALGGITGSVAATSMVVSPYLGGNHVLSIDTLLSIGVGIVVVAGIAITPVAVVGGGITIGVISKFYLM